MMIPDDDFRRILAEILDGHDRGVEAFKQASAEMVSALSRVRKARIMLDDAEGELATIQQRQSAALEQFLAANRAVLNLLREREQR